MGKDDTGLAIISTLVRDDIKDVDGWDERFKVACKSAQGNGIFTDDDLQFRGMIGGCMIAAEDEGDDEMLVRLTEEVRAIKTLSAMLSGVSVDLASVQLENPIGLVGIWKESKEA